ncbi:hypothetical protein EDC01DRAFT_789387 [Geopyxis carbonaria]|nr:hypothetical protein EDC01DRAFT_789387 [Geopyxis carbonaria]
MPPATRKTLRLARSALPRDTKSQSLGTPRSVKRRNIGTAIYDVSPNGSEEEHLQTAPLVMVDGKLMVAPRESEEASVPVLETASAVIAKKAAGENKVSALRKHNTRSSLLSRTLAMLDPPTPSAKAEASEVFKKEPKLEEPTCEEEPTLENNTPEEKAEESNEKPDEKFKEPRSDEPDEKEQSDESAEVVSSRLGNLIDSICEEALKDITPVDVLAPVPGDSKPESPATADQSKGEAELQVVLPATPSESSKRQSPVAESEAAVSSRPVRRTYKRSSKREAPPQAEPGPEASPTPAKRSKRTPKKALQAEAEAESEAATSPTPAKRSKRISKKPEPEPEPEAAVSTPSKRIRKTPKKYLQDESEPGTQAAVSPPVKRSVKRTPKKTTKKKQPVIETPGGPRVVLGTYNVKAFLSAERKGKTGVWYRVHWEGYPVTDATWEAESTLREDLGDVQFEAFLHGMKKLKPKT